jgi:hypothetical protein
MAVDDSRRGEPCRSGLSGVRTRLGIAGDESKRGPGAANRVVDRGMGENVPNWKDVSVFVGSEDGCP